MKNDKVFALVCPAATCSIEVVMWNGSVAGGTISSCLYLNCDQVDSKWAPPQTSTATTEQSRGRGAYGSGTTGQKEHCSKMNAEVPATKLTLTCQISGVSKKRLREGVGCGGGGGGEEEEAAAQTLFVLSATG